MMQMQIRERVAIDKVEDVFLRELSRPDVTIEFFEFVSKIPIPAVEFELASHKNISIDLMERLFYEGKQHSLMGLSTNENLPSDIFLKICETEDDFILTALATNNKTPIPILIKTLSIENCDDYLKEDIAQSINNKSDTEKSEYINNMKLQIHNENDSQLKYNLIREIKLFKELENTLNNIEITLKDL